MWGFGLCSSLIGLGVYCRGGQGHDLRVHCGGGWALLIGRAGGTGEWGWPMSGSLLVGFWVHQ